MVRSVIPHRQPTSSPRPGRIRRMGAFVAVLTAFAATALSAPGVANAGSATPDPLDGTVVAAASMNSGRHDLFTVGSDLRLRHRTYADGQWTGWQDLGGALTSAPAVASWGANRLDVFARGIDNTLQHIWYDGTWHKWESLGGKLTSAPTVASWEAGRLDIFARTTGNTMIHKWFASGWSNWENLGGGLTSAPTAASWGKSRLDVFARGKDNALWHKYFNGKWSGWESLGGLISSAPSAASWGANRLDIMARGGDNYMYQRWYDGKWHPWVRLTGPLGSAPAVTARASTRLDIFALDAKGEVLQQSYYGSSGGWGVLRRIFGMAPAVPAVRNSPTVALQGTPAAGALAAPVEYAYVDAIGRLRVGHQPSPDAYGSIEWKVISDGEEFTGRPALAEQADGRMQVAGHTTGGDIWLRSHQAKVTSPVWGPWNRAGGWVNSGPTVGRLPDGRLVTFAVDADRRLWARQQLSPNGAYDTWRTIGTTQLVEAPTVVRNRTGLQLFARNAAGALLTVTYLGVPALPAWTEVGTGTNGAPAVVALPGFRMQVFARAADGSIVMKSEDAAGGWPAEWQSTGTFVAAGAPAAILDPALGRTAVVARGTDNEIYRVWEAAPGSGTWGEWSRVIMPEDPTFSDPAATDPTVVPITNASGETWYIVFRNANDTTVIYERTLPTRSAAVADDRATTTASPDFAAKYLPAAPANP